MLRYERELLRQLQEAHDRGAFSVACDKLRDRISARRLTERGYAEWRGDLWGSSFWSITDAGRAALKEAKP